MKSERGDFVKKVLPIFLITLLLTSCGGDIVARVGNIKITTPEFSFYLNEIKTQMQGTELATDDDWETQEIEGKKAIDVAKERALESAIENALYIEASKAAGIEFTSEDITNKGDIKTQIVLNYGGDNAYNRYLRDNGITNKFMDMMIESSAYLDKIRERLSVERPETDEEISDYYEKNKAELEARFRKAKHILFATVIEGTNIPISMSDKDKAKREAQQILKRARAGEDFDTLMNEFSQDPGLSTNPDGYFYETGDMVAEFEECVDSLDYETIAMCESPFGYHIVKREPVTFEDLKESIRMEIQNEKVKETVYGWAEEYGVVIEKFEENYKDIK